MSSIRRLRTQRVLSDSAACAEAQASLENTLARRAEAQRVLDEINREAAVSEEVARTLAARLDESRYALLGVCVGELPDDILRSIFEMLVCYNDADDCEPRTPFILAAVCARWRKIALSSPRVWSTVYAVPTHPTGAYMATDHARIMTLLSRSRAAPLDIVVLWVNYANDHPSHEVEVFSDILKILGAHVSRWRTVVMYWPKLAERGIMMLECLKGPTPMLEHLDFLVVPTTIRPSGGGYLPFAPKLHTLEFSYVGMDCSTLSAFPALEILRLSSCGSTEQALYDYATRAPSLVELDISITVNRAPRTKIVLSNLRRLRIGQRAQSLLLEPTSAFLNTPQLVELQLDCSVDDRMRAFFDAISPTVRVLSISQRLDSGNLSLLRRLQNVETLKLSEEPVDNAALDQLASANPPIWPRLSVLRDMGYTGESGTHILRLVTARNVESFGAFAELDPAARPCKILQLEFRADYGDPEAPSWLLQEVERILRL